MDIEQLKLILETIDSLGGDAKTFGIWYLISQIVPGLISAVTFVIVMWMFFKAIRGIVTTGTAGRTIASELNVELPRFGDWQDHHTDRCLTQIRKYKRDRKANDLQIEELKEQLMNN